MSSSFYAQSSEVGTEIPAPADASTETSNAPSSFYQDGLRYSDTNDDALIAAVQAIADEAAASAAAALAAAATAGPSNAEYLVKTANSTLTAERVVGDSSTVAFDWSTPGAVTASVPGAALTKVDDTNVTLTLGGTPSTALLRATSVTVGWSGTLAASRGGTGLSSLGTGVATWLGTPSSANLQAAVTDETGTGALVFATSPTLASPALTGVPTAPTASPGTDTTQIATTAFVSAAIREQLTANRNYYVDWDSGSDSNDGFTSPTAFKTLQKAADVIGQTIDPNGYRITINVADSVSTQTGVAFGFLYSSASSIIYVKGNLTTPGNVKIGNSSVAGSFRWTDKPVGVGSIFVAGVRSVATNGPCFYADPVQVGDLPSFVLGDPDGLVDNAIELYGGQASGPVLAGNLSDLGHNGGINSILIDGASLSSPSSIVQLLQRSTMSLLNAVITITGTPTLSQGLIYAKEGGGALTMWEDTIVGAVTGRKYYLNPSSVSWDSSPTISIVSGGSIDSIPGSLAGVANFGRIIDGAGLRDYFPFAKVGGGTATTSSPVLDISQTWNSGGTTFTGIKSNITNTASASGSLLMDLQVGGVSKLSVRKDGKASATDSFIAPTIAGTDDVSAAMTQGGTLSEGFRLSDNNVITWAPTQWWGTADLALKRVSSGVLGVNNATGAGTSGDILTRALRSVATTFASAVASPADGTLQAFTDSTTNTPGATITGGGSNHVLGYYNGTNWVVSAAGAADEVAIVFVIDGGGSTITTGAKGDLSIPFACTITGQRVLLDQSGSIVIDIWKDTYANFPPTVADTITASAKPTISSATKTEDTTLTGWTKTIAAGDTLRFNVDSVTTAQRATITLKARKT